MASALKGTDPKMLQLAESVAVIADDLIKMGGSPDGSLMVGKLCTFASRHIVNIRDSQPDRYDMDITIISAAKKHLSITTRFTKEDFAGYKTDVKKEVFGSWGGKIKTFYPGEWISILASAHKTLKAEVERKTQSYFDELRQ